MHSHHKHFFHELLNMYKIYIFHICKKTAFSGAISLASSIPTLLPGPGSDSSFLQMQTLGHGNQDSYHRVPATPVGDLEFSGFSPGCHRHMGSQPADGTLCVPQAS